MTIKEIRILIRRRKELRKILRQLLAAREDGMFDLSAIEQEIKQLDKQLQPLLLGKEESE